jgi:hypothetical protein
MPPEEEDDDDDEAEAFGVLKPGRIRDLFTRRIS